MCNSAIIVKINLLFRIILQIKVNEIDHDEKYKISKVASLYLKVNVSNSVGAATAKYDHPPCILRLKVIVLLLFHADVDICSFIFISENTVLMNNDPNKPNTLSQESQILKP